MVTTLTKLAAPLNLDTLFQIIAVTAYPIEHTTRYSLVFKSVNMNECSGAKKLRVCAL